MFTVTLNADKIVVRLESILSKNYTVNSLPELEDYIVNNYRPGQLLHFVDGDGNNCRNSQFVYWLRRLQSALGIGDGWVMFETQIRPPESYTWIQQQDYYRICDFDSLNRDLSQARFVGCLSASRWTMARIRMIYELDCAFPGDTYITCNVENYIHHVGLSHEYFQQEINWLKTKVFEKDVDSPTGGNMLNMHSASISYANIWNQFKIEIVCETEEYLNERFTDKVAKVLSTGKPFLLLSGRGSLQYLKNLGFQTFNGFIDESYDDCQLPTQRTHAIINSLKKLYQSNSRDSVIGAMYDQAYKNIEIYNRVCRVPMSNMLRFPKL